MATLITGGAGFIGSRLASHLIKNNETIVILDNFDSYYDPATKRANVALLQPQPIVVEGDIRDTACLERIFTDYSITRVAHLAGLAGVRSSIENGPLYAEINTRGSVDLMDMARKHKVEVFIQASTSSVYGQTSHVPFTEDEAPDHPLAPYPASKRAAEIFGYSYYHLFGLNVTVLRFFNVYGPYGRPDMMPLRAIESILNEKMINLYGGGGLKRDWTFVDDIVDGVIAALERPMGYQVVNLGYGSPLSLNEFIQIYEGLIGKKAVTQTVPMPGSEPVITYCDNTRAKELLGFAPKVDIREGLRRTWEWYQVHHLGKH